MRVRTNPIRAVNMIALTVMPTTRFSGSAWDICWDGPRCLRGSCPSVPPFADYLRCHKHLRIQYQSPVRVCARPVWTCARRMPLLRPLSPPVHTIRDAKHASTAHIYISFQLMEEAWNEENKIHSSLRLHRQRFQVSFAIMNLIFIALLCLGFQDGISVHASSTLIAGCVCS